MRKKKEPSTTPRTTRTSPIPIVNSSHYCTHGVIPNQLSFQEQLGLNRIARPRIRDERAKT